MKVVARRDIVSSGGMPIAPEGAVGEVARDRLPARAAHRGLVPVLWKSRRRAYWVKPEDLEVRGRGNLDKFVQDSPASENDLPPPPVPRFEGEVGYHFGRTLQQIRRARGLSQEALSEKMRKAGAARVSQATLSKWESRSDSPSGKFIEMAAKALDVPAFLFFVAAEDLPACMEFLRQFEGNLQRGGANAGRCTLEEVRTRVG